MQKGFTVIEFLIAIIILAIIVTITYTSLSRLNSDQLLDKQADLVRSIISEARSLTLSSQDAAQYGVYFEASGLTLFKGDTYSVSDPDNIVTTLDSRVSLRDINFAGGSGDSVVFQRLTGETINYGSLEIYLIASSTNFHTITVTTTGVVE